MPFEEFSSPITHGKFLVFSVISSKDLKKFFIRFLIYLK